jgi:hypothetical protein
MVSGIYPGKVPGTFFFLPFSFSTLALDGNGCVVELVDLASGQTCAKLGENFGGKRHMAFSTDGAMLAYTGTKGKAF